MLIVLTGKSCSGKDAIKKELLKKKKDLKNIITYTTRPKRAKEKDGINYHFVSDNTFLEMIENNEFAEFKEYVIADGKSWFYGCVAKDIERAEDDDYVIILTPQGVRDLKVEFDDIPMKVIYVYSNRSTIKERLKNRKDDLKESERRMQKDDKDFQGWENEATKIVYNNLDNDLNEVVEKVIRCIYE